MKLSSHPYSVKDIIVTDLKGSAVNHRELKPIMESTPKAEPQSLSNDPKFIRISI